MYNIDFINVITKILLLVLNISYSNFYLLILVIVFG